MKLNTLVFALIIALSQSVMAQRAATVRGIVSDELGAVIVGATVLLTNQHRRERRVQIQWRGARKLFNLGYTDTIQLLATKRHKSHKMSFDSV